MRLNLTTWDIICLGKTWIQVSEGQSREQRTENTHPTFRTPTPDEQIQVTGFRSNSQAVHHDNGCFVDLAAWRQ